MGQTPTQLGGHRSDNGGGFGDATEGLTLKLTYKNTWDYHGKGLDVSVLTFWNRSKSVHFFVDRNWTFCGRFRASPLLSELDRRSGQFCKKVGFEPVLSINGLLQHILFRLCQMCLCLKSGQFLSKVDSFLPSVQVAGQAF